MNEFLTWESLLIYSNFVSIVYLIVEFTKEIKQIKKIPTKYWSFLLSFFILIIIHLANDNFQIKDIFLYFLTSVTVSLSANGLNDFNKKTSN